MKKRNECNESEGQRLSDATSLSSVLPFQPLANYRGEHLTFISAAACTCSECLTCLIYSLVLPQEMGWCIVNRNLRCRVLIYGSFYHADKIRFCIIAVKCKQDNSIALWYAADKLVFQGTPFQCNFRCNLISIVMNCGSLSLRKIPAT